MTSGFELRCARTECLAHCVHEQLAFLVALRPAVILYGSVNGIYIEDVNDDPDRADEWYAAEETWLDRAYAAHQKLIAGESGFAMRVSRRHRGWIATVEAEVPREMLSALASFGTDPVLWTTLPEPRSFGSDLDLARVLQDVPRWLVHGYKEPFLVIGTREPVAVIAQILDAAITSSPFCPHRARTHAKAKQP